MRQPRLRIVVFCTAFLLEMQLASAAKLPTLSAAVLCAPSVEDAHQAGAPSHLCLVKIAPLFTATSVEVIPKAARKHFGAEVAIRF